MKTHAFVMPTSFTPYQLELLRELVSTAQSRGPAIDEKGKELHNLGVRLNGYCETADAAARRMALARTG